MKKLAKIFAVVLVCALAVTALVACAPKPNTNYDEALANLKENKFSVLLAVKEGDTGAEAQFALMASGVDGLKAEDIEAVLSGSKMDEKTESGDIISMVWFTNEDAANKYYDVAKKNFDKQKEDAQKSLDELQAELDEMKAGEEKDEAQEVYDAIKKMADSLVCGKTGLVVYSGTTGGVNATK